jgi:hypothetical protein
MSWLGSLFSFVRTTEEFDGSEGGVWLSAENGDTLDGVEIFDYWAMSSLYEAGVYTKFEEALNARGWYSEFYDAGTVGVWPN